MVENKQLLDNLLNYDKAQRLKANHNTQRFIYADILKQINNFYKLKNIPNIIFLIGLRGVGKTTILNTILHNKDSIYTSGDFLFRNNINLKQFFDSIKDIDRPIIIIDEIQYLNWQLDIKIFADQNPDKLIIISGSSSININKFSADLVRRAKTFVVEPLSFREYLLIKNNLTIDYNDKIKEIIFSDSRLQEKYFDLIKIELKMNNIIIKEFNNYLLSSFPYMIETYDKNVIKDLIYKVIYEDIPKIENFNAENIELIKNILHFLTINEKTSITTISTNTGKAKSLILKFINLLEKAKLIDFIENATPTRRLNDIKKYLFYTPNFRLALSEDNNSDVDGFSKEDLFVRIIRLINKDVKYNYDNGQIDFYVNNKAFEIGSNKKSVAKDNVIIIYSGELKYDGRNLYVPFYLFALIQ